MLLNLIKHQQPSAEKICLYICQGAIESNYQLLMEGKKVGIKQLKSSKAFIDYSQTIDDVYENLTKKGRF